MFVLLSLLGAALVVVLLYRSIKVTLAARRGDQNAKRHAHLELHDQVLQQALQEAQAAGIEPAFRRYVDGILAATGRNKLQVGHLFWIFDQLEQGKPFTANLDIPNFNAGDD